MFLCLCKKMNTKKKMRKRKKRRGERGGEENMLKVLQNLQ